MTDAVHAILDQYRTAMMRADELKADADLAEERRKIILAQQSPDGLSERKADNAARTSAPYLAHIETQCIANVAAAKAKSEVEYLRMRLEIWRTRESSRREFAKHGER